MTIHPFLMKRLVWLILAAFGTLLAQVQPMDLPVTKHEVCGCCEQSGACGMPDCVPIHATPVQPAFNLQSPVAVARVVLKEAAPAPRGSKNSFYVQFESSSPARPALRAPVVAPPASVPLFTAHCSFLI